MRNICMDQQLKLPAIGVRDADGLSGAPATELLVHEASDGIWFCHLDLGKSPTKSEASSE